MLSSQVSQSPSCRAHKFGGSSLADAGRIRHVASLMLDAGESRQVVVVSAMQGTTNALIAMTAAAAAGDDWQSTWSALRTQHADAASPGLVLVAHCPPRAQRPESAEGTAKGTASMASMSASILPRRALAAPRSAMAMSSWRVCTSR